MIAETPSAAVHKGDVSMFVCTAALLASALASRLQLPGQQRIRGQATDCSSMEAAHEVCFETEDSGCSHRFMQMVLPARDGGVGRQLLTAALNVQVCPQAGPAANGKFGSVCVGSIPHAATACCRFHCQERKASKQSSVQVRRRGHSR